MEPFYVVVVVLRFKTSPQPLNVINVIVRVETNR